MNRKSISYPQVALIVCAAMSVIAAVLRIALTLTSLDVHGVYVRGAVLPTVYHTLLALTAAAFILCAFKFIPNRTDSHRHPTSEISVFMSFLIGFLFIADAVITLYNILKGNPSLTRFDTLELIFSIPSAVYFIACALKPKLSSAAVALTSVFPTAWCAVCLIRIYFDKSLLMTDPGRILAEMSLLAAMIAFLSESRAQLGKFSHRFFMAATPTASVLLFGSAIPDLILSDKLMLGTSGSLLRSAICLALALFFVIRLAVYAKHYSNSSDK